MSNELLQQVKDEYARSWATQTAKRINHPFENWIQFIQTADIHYIDDYVDRIAVKYSAALQSENDRLKSDMQSVIDKHVLIEKTFEQMKVDVLEFRETLNTIMKCRDLWGVPDGEIPVEHRGEYAVLRAIEVKIKEAIEKTAHYEQ